MDAKTIKQKLDEKDGTCFAVVVKAQKYYTYCLAISEYKHLGDGRFKFVSSPDRGVWQNNSGAEWLNREIKELEDAGFVVFRGRPSKKHLGLN
jgi:hypothetical protein